MKEFTTADLAQILDDMASYARECACNGEDTTHYFDEIVRTGLFHDACGKCEGRSSGKTGITNEY